MRRILIIEDEKSIQNVIKAFLENEKYDVETADDGLEAINILQNHNYDLILLDLMIPKIDGYTVCEMIRKNSNVPIIILTALTDEESQIKGFDKLADDYITKPFSMPVVLKHIEALFRRMENKDNEKLLLKTFGYIPERGKFIETIMNEGCPCYVKKETISPMEASSLIREAGGKVVLAHPVAYKYEDGLTDDDISELVRKMKPDGIEANYVYLDRNGNKINESIHWNDFAKHHNLITTIGSDFHKVDNVHPDIGLINEDITLDNKEVNTIIDNLLN